MESNSGSMGGTGPDALPNIIVINKIAREIRIPKQKKMISHTVQHQVTKWCKALQRLHVGASAHGVIGHLYALVLSEFLHLLCRY